MCENITSCKVVIFFFFFPFLGILGRIHKEIFLIQKEQARQAQYLDKALKKLNCETGNFFKYCLIRFHLLNFIVKLYVHSNVCRYSKSLFRKNLYPLMVC